MGMVFYATTIITTIIIILNLVHRRRKFCRTPFSIDWPILGMLPKLLYNAYRYHDLVAQVLKQKGGTVQFMGPWFSNMNYLFTSDPINAHHMLVKSFDNYVKGPHFRDTFRPFGDGIVTTDAETWRHIRSLYHSLLRNKSFETFVETTTQHKVQSSLLPILHHLEKHGILVNIQDVFCRLTFDLTCLIAIGNDPNCLSIEFPVVDAEKAFDELEDCMMYRHIVPKFVWKFQEWLQLGEEKKLANACRVFEQFIYALIESKRQELSRCKRAEMGCEDHHHLDLFSTILREEKYKTEASDEKFLRDSAFNLFIAGRDTIASALTWFFWLVATNPSVEAKIVEEIKENFGSNNEEMKDKVVLGKEEVKKLVYLHGALCETLRLFPPIPVERKQPVKSDILPSGHHVNSDTQILFSFYGMGRSEEIWGEDCLEFKPERWITEKGEIVHVPSHKFIAFNAGPRTCLGKDMSFIQLKIVAIAILSNYCVQLVEGHQVIPSLSIVLLMKHGLKVRITKREI